MGRTTVGGYRDGRFWLHNIVVYLPDLMISLRNVLVDPGAHPTIISLTCLKNKTSSITPEETRIKPYGGMKMQTVGSVRTRWILGEFSVDVKTVVMDVGFPEAVIGMNIIGNHNIKLHFDNPRPAMWIGSTMIEGDYYVEDDIAVDVAGAESMMVEKSNADLFEDFSAKKMADIVRDYCLKKYPERFNDSDFRMKPQYNFQINHKPGSPTYLNAGQTFLNPAMVNILRPLVQTNLDRGIFRELDIEPHEALILWLHQILGVKKPNGNGHRLVSDLVPINPHIEGFEYVLPSLDTILQRIASAISNIKAGQVRCMQLDQVSAFNQLGIDSPDKCFYFAFVFDGKIYIYEALPQGLYISTAVFQHTLERVYLGLRGVIIYVDDVSVLSGNNREFMERVDRVMRRAEMANMIFNPDKMVWCTEKPEFVGLKFVNNQLELPHKYYALIEQLKFPKTQKQLRRWVGLVQYIARFIPQCPKLMLPFRQYLKKGARIPKDSSGALTIACERVKETLSKMKEDGGVLILPDWNTKFVLDGDACEESDTAIVRQENGIILYYGHLFTDAEKYQHISFKELHPHYATLKRYKAMLYGARVESHTDHLPLVALLVFPYHKLPSHKFMRMCEYIHSFPNYGMVYVPGVLNDGPDFFSREIDYEKERMDINIVDITRGYDEEHNSEGDMKCDMASVGEECLSLINENMIEREVDCIEEVSHAILFDFHIFLINDPYHEPLHSLLTKGKYIVKDKSTAGLKRAQKVMSHYCLKDDKWNIQRRGGWKVVPPIEEREHICRETHLERKHGYPTDIVKSVKEKGLWWYDMERTSSYVFHTCDMCLAAGRVRTYQPKPGTLSADYFNHVVGMDTITDLPLSENGNTSIHIMVDHHGKVTRLNPIPSRQAKIQSNSYIKTWMSKFGISDVLCTDCGTEFDEELYSWLGANHHTSAPYVHRGNGEAESAIRYVTEMVRASLLEWNSDNWELFLPFIEYAINTRIHSSTGISPYRYLYGRDPPALRVTRSDNLESILKVIECCSEKVNIKEKKKRVKAAERGIKHLYSEPKVGDIVYRKLVKEEKEKQNINRCDGPWRVVAKEDHQCTIEDIKNEGKIFVRHIKDLIPTALHEVIITAPSKTTSDVTDSVQNSSV